MPFYDAERAGTQPARHTFYDADRADEAKNEVKAHKIASYHNAFRWHTAWMTQSVPARSLMVKIVAEVKCAASSAIVCDVFLLGTHFVGDDVVLTRQCFKMFGLQNRNTNVHSNFFFRILF